MNFALHRAMIFVYRGVCQYTLARGKMIEAACSQCAWEIHTTDVPGEKVRENQKPLLAHYICRLDGGQVGMISTVVKPAMSDATRRAEFKSRKHRGVLLYYTEKRPKPIPSRYTF